MLQENPPISYVAFLLWRTFPLQTAPPIKINTVSIEFIEKKVGRKRENFPHVTHLVAL